MEITRGVLTIPALDVTVLTSPQLADSVIEWNPISDRVALIRLRMKRGGVLAVVQVYGPNDESDYDVFLEDGTLQGIPKGDLVLLMGDINARVGRDLHLSQLAHGVTTDHSDR